MTSVTTKYQLISFKIDKTLIFPHLVQSLYLRRRTWGGVLTRITSLGKLEILKKQLLTQNAYYSYITHDQKRLLGCKHQKGHFEFHPCAPYLDRHVQQYPLFLGR